MRKALTLLVVLFVASTARADESDVLTRLMQEPLTLFDWGMAQLDRDIERVARETFEERLGLGRPAANARFDPEKRQVILGATMTLPPANRSEATCIQAFREIVAGLAKVAPRGHKPLPWYLQNAFQPDGHTREGSSEDIGARLLEVVRLYVFLVPTPSDTFKGDIRMVFCHGRLDAQLDQITVEETP